MPDDPTSDLPLAGIRVLDLSRILAGPYCSMTLGDLGAEIIKVERPKVGDDTRTWGPPFAEGESAYYLCCNRNKKSITIDLKNSRGRALVKELARSSDVVIENFTPGLMQRFGLDFETLREGNPRLIYCSISAYGQDGPYRDRPGYDMVLSAVGGLMGITGPEGGEPCKVGVAITDVVTGISASGAIMAALIHRGRSGRGQYIDCSLLDIQVAALANIASNWLVADKEAKRWGTAHESIIPYQVFDAKDRPIAIAVANQKLWESFCQAIGKPEWMNDPRFESNPNRVENRKELVARIADVMAQKTCDEWVDLFVGAAIPCGPVNNMEGLFHDPQVLHRGMIAEVPHETIGTLRLTGVPIKYSETPASIRLPPPLLGQHTEEILTEVLGYTPEQIDALRQAGAV